jgi:YHS domain-containing protein
MKRMLLIVSIIVLTGIVVTYFVTKEPVFNATNGFLVNLNKQGVFIEGYDPVAYFTNNEALKGNSQFSADYNGGTYWFSSADHREIFKQEPAKYAPQFGAFCGYAVSIGKLRPVDPEIFQIENGKLILQHTQEAYELFNKNLKENILKANMNWPKLVATRGGKNIEFDKPASPTASN